ncbi:MAG: nitroreductase [Christensenellaceae bacterium]|nr:nitroreductase [Christensenellaceae bacterium]
MDILSIIKERRSVRTFDGRALLPEDKAKIENYINSGKNPYMINVGWSILDAKENRLASPVIVGAETYITGKVSPVPHAEEAFGWAFESMVIFAWSIGVGTTWIAGTMDRAAFEKASALARGETMPCVSPLGYAAKKMSFREMMMRKGVKADSRYPFESLFFKDGFGTPLFYEEAGDIKDALEAVRRAPSAVNKQPWRAVITDGAVHFYEKKSGGYVSASGWDLQKVDMGIALAHFDMVTKEAGIGTEFLIRDPGIRMPEGTEYIASFILAG